MESIKKLRGLTAEDRAAWEQENIDRLNEKYNYSNRSETYKNRVFKNELFREAFGHLSNYDSLVDNMSSKKRDEYYENYYNIVLSQQDSSQEESESILLEEPENTVLEDTDNTQEEGFFTKRQKEANNNSEGRISKFVTLQDTIDDYYDENSKKLFDNVKSVKARALEISPYYQKYTLNGSVAANENNEYLKLSDSDWEDITKSYIYHLENSGQEDADTYLQNVMQDTVAKNQSTGEKYWNGLRNFGASFTGDLVSTVGMITGGLAATFGFYDEMFGEREDIEGASGFVNYIDKIIDNPITRYGNDIIQYGTLDTNTIRALKESHGLSELEIVKTAEEQEKGILAGFSRNTIPDIISQGGYTVASILTGSMYGKAAKWGFKGAKGATMNTMKKAGKNVSDVKKTLTKIQKIEGVNSKVIIPGMVGTSEAVLNGLGTKDQVMQEGINTVKEKHQQELEERYNEVIATQPNISEEDARIVAEAELIGKYEEALKQVEYNATKAGYRNFMWSSTVNGMINTTLKAGLQSDYVQDHLRKSKVFGRMYNSSPYSISGSGDTHSVSHNFGKGKTAYHISKEFLGETLEEYSQELGGLSAEAAANYNITSFIDNKYNGDAQMAVGEMMLLGEMWEGAKGMAKGAISPQALTAAAYGGLSTVIRPNFRLSRYFTKEKAGDKYKTKLSLKRREGESVLEHALRISPFESGFTSGYLEAKELKRQYDDEAKSVEAWVNEPGNLEKLNSVTGSISWMKDMEDNAYEGNEFGFRNTKLGKSINDVLMIEKLKGTDFYNSLMEDIATRANLKAGTKDAQNYINQVKNNPELGFEGKTDEEILEVIKDNAVKMQDLISKVKQESQSIEQSFGNMDNDVKESLIFGQLSIEDWKKRDQQLTPEIDKVIPQIKSTVERGEASKSDLEIISKHGTIQKALRYKEEVSSMKDDLDSKIKRLEDREKSGDITENEKSVLKNYKDTRKEVVKELDDITKLLKGKDASSTNVVLNEEQILSLPVEERAEMLNLKNLNKYSKKQRDIIKSVINQGKVVDKEFNSKVVDLGKIKYGIDKFIDQYNDMLMDPMSYSLYARRARREASLYAMKGKYDHLSQMVDYKEFSKEMDKFYKEADDYQKKRVARELIKSNNQLYQRYIQNKTDISNITDQLFEKEEFQDLHVEDINNLLTFMDYLQSEGIDVFDEESAQQSLISDNGKSFNNYVDSFNEGLNEEDKVVVSDIGELFQLYKESIKTLNKDRQQIEATNKPIEVTTTDNSNKPNMVYPTPSVQENPKPETETAKSNNTEQSPKKESNTKKTNKKSLFGGIQRYTGNENESSIITPSYEEEGRDFTKWVFNTYKYKENLTPEKIKSLRGKKVYFITTEEATNKSKESFKAGNGTYEDSRHRPILMVVEDPNGAIGGKYTLVGILPANSGNIPVNGGNFITRVRNQGIKTKDNTVITDENGKPFYITFNTNETEAYNTVPKGEKRPSIREALRAIGINDADTFIEKVKFNKQYYIENEGVADVDKKNVLLFVRSINEFFEGISDFESTFSNLLENNDYFKGAYEALTKALIHLKENNSLSDNENITSINNVLRNFFYINNNLQIQSNIKYNDEGESEAFTFNLYDTNNNVLEGLTSFNPNEEDVAVAAKRLLQKIIFEPQSVKSGNVPKVRVSPTNPNNDGIGFQVDYPKESLPLESANIKATLKRAYRNNVFSVGRQGLGYKGVPKFTFSIPREFKPETSTTTTTNTNNSTIGSKNNGSTVNEATSSKGDIVEGTTGTVVEKSTSEVKSTTAQERAKEIVSRIQKNSRKLKLSESDHIYSKNGITYTSVTSFIRDDEDIDSTESGVNWKPVATSIGNSVDELVRDFLGNRLKLVDGKITDEEASRYSNMSKKDIEEFLKSLSQFKNYSESKGITFVTSDISTSGIVEVIDEEGNTKTEYVAGTLDVLAYDSEGNFYIYDMKTHRKGSINEESLKKYTKQLSLYKALLENEYGIEIKSINILPIEVNYEAPSGFKGSEANWEVKENSNQLVLNGEEFKDAKPKFNKTIVLAPTEFKITKEELNTSFKETKEILDNTPDETSGIITDKNTVEVTTPSTFKEDSTTGVKMGTVKSRRRRPISDAKSSLKPTGLTLSSKWDNYTDEEGNPLDKKTTESILSKEYTKEIWETMSEEEQEQTIKCKGFFII